jgi:hypothetical protein
MAPWGHATPRHCSYSDYFGGDITASVSVATATMLATISFKKWSLAARGPPPVKLLKAFLTEVGVYMYGSTNQARRGWSYVRTLGFI